MGKATDWKTINRHALSSEYEDLDGKLWEDFQEAFQLGRIPDAIVVWVFQGQVIDGWQRMRCCRQFDIKPTLKELKLRNGMTPEEFVQIANDHRRHESNGKAQARIEARRERIGAARRNGQSTRDIAKEEGVSQKTVRNDLDSVQGEEGYSPESEKTPGRANVPSGKTLGKDGKLYTTKVLCARCKRVAPGVGIKGCESCKAEKAARKTGKTAGDYEKPARGKGARREESKAEKSKPADKDALGNPIPKNLRDVFGDLFLSTAIAQCKEMEKWSKSSAKDFPYLLLEPIVEGLTKTRLAFEAAMPHAVHQACSGGGCHMCRSSGYLPEWRFFELKKTGEKT